MSRKANRKTELPAHVKEEAAALKVLFKKHARLSQEEFGARFDLGTQGNVWQYLNGYLELSTETAPKFSRGLQRPVREFSPRLAAEIDEMHRRAASGEPTRVHRHAITDRGKDLAAEWEQLDERLKAAIEVLVYTLGAARARGNPLPVIAAIASAAAADPSDSAGDQPPAAPPS